MPRKLTVDAVIIKDRRVLLVKRKNDPGKGYYALPGGYVDSDEDIKKAVVREVKEETGLTVRPVRMIGVYDDPARDERGNVSIAFLSKVIKGKAKASSDAADVRFFETEKLPPKIAFDHKKIISDGVKVVEKKKVLAGGVFNIIHPGHCYFLLNAKRLGDELVVVVANDKTVLKNKKRLLFPAKMRAGLVKSLACVDRVLIGDEHDQLALVKLEKPDVIAMGYDQDVARVRRQLKKAGIKCKVVQLGKLKGCETKKITGG